MISLLRIAAAFPSYVSLRGTTRPTRILQKTFLLGAIFSQVWGAHANTIPMTAWGQLVMQASGRASNPSGLALVLGDCAMAMDLLSNSRFVVICQEPDVAKQQATARVLDEAGFMAAGRAVTVACPLNEPVLADGSANLIVATVQDKQTLANFPLKRLVSTLAPYGGVLFLRGSVLNEKSLRAWIKPIAEDDCVIAKVERGVSGAYAMVKRTRLRHGDDWGFRNHGPDNNWVSSDAVIKPQLSAQWMGLPMYGTSGTISTIVADGLVFLAKAIKSTVKETPDGLQVLCRDVANGQPLWQKDYPEAGSALTSCIIRWRDGLYLRTGGKVLHLDPLTGAQRGAWTPDDRPQAWVSWLTAAKRTIVTLSCSPQAAAPYAKPASIIIDNPAYNNGPTLVTHEGTVFVGNPQFADMGDRVTALDAKSGAVRWLWSGGMVDSRAIAGCGDRMYVAFPGKHLTCLDANNGRVLWRVDLSKPEILKRFNVSKWPAFYTHYLPVLRVSDQAVVLGWPDYNHMVAFSAQDGHVLWDILRDGDSWWIEGNRLIVAGSEKRATIPDGVAYDLITGKPIGTVPGAGKRVCATTVSSSHGYWSAINGPMADRNNNTYIHHISSSRAPCTIGQLPILANGTYVSTPCDCICNDRFRGWNAWTANQGWQDRGAHVELLSDVRPAALKTDARDWLQCRGNVERSGSSSVAIGQELKVQWTQKPVHSFRQGQCERKTAHGLEPQFVPTPPVTAGHLIFVGGDDGALRAFTSSQGTPRWTVYTGARMMEAPTVTNDRVYVASADGHVWCMAAANGTILWRYRLAPREDIILAYGHPVSRWPVMGLLVQDGTVYAAAGLEHDDGGVLCAVDAVTGAERWRHHGIVTPSEYGKTSIEVPFCPVGGLSMAHGLLWVRSADNDCIRFNPTTGALIPTKNRASAVDGAGIGLFGDSFVVQGGRPWFWESWEHFVRNNQVWVFSESDANNNVLSPNVVLLGSTGVRPAWDQQLMVSVPTPLAKQAWSGDSAGRPAVNGGYHVLEGWDVPQTVDYLRTTRLFYAGLNLKKGDGSVLNPVRVDLGLLMFGPQIKGWDVPKQVDWETVVLSGRKIQTGWPSRPQKRWKLDDIIVRTVALSKDYALAVMRVPEATDVKNYSCVLRVLDRVQGTTIQEIKLPSEPVFDGLAIDRDGRVILALQDGTVMALAGKGK